jgi:hypothetical protein
MERSTATYSQVILEIAMNNTGKDKDQVDRKSRSDKAPLEDLARKIDPPSREVSGTALKYPDRMTLGPRRSTTGRSIGKLCFDPAKKKPATLRLRA